MGRKVNFLLFICLMIVAVFVAQAGGQTPSPRDLLKQYVADLQRSPNDHALREKIIKLASELKPPPVVPDDAERHFLRGAAFIKDAKSESDYRDAGAEFEKAVASAPWFANAYYNLGVAQSKAGDYAGAARSLKFYLLVTPNAPDTQQAKALMYEMEVKAEKQVRERARQQEEAAIERARREAEARARATSFEGRWVLSGMESSFYRIDRSGSGYVVRKTNMGGPQPYSVRVDGNRLILREDWNTADREIVLTLSDEGSQLQGTDTWQRPTEAQRAYTEERNRQTGRQARFAESLLNNPSHFTLYRR